jgi:hypothetical protein
MARFDLGLSIDEFWELTPGMFQALCKRRNISIKYDRYANALTASAIYNSNRASADDPVVTAFDFIRPEEDAARLDKIRKGKQYAKKAIGNLPMMTTTREKYLEARTRAIADLTASGYEDAEGLFNEVWPHLMPMEEGTK